MTDKPIPELLEFCIINVNKPSGPTSHIVCKKIGKIFHAKKAGHFGTLDPMVTGVLPVALNRATRLSGHFMGHDKEYIGKMHLHSDISLKELKEEMKNFIGKIEQLPPVRSRVKRVLRERTINRFKIIKKEGREVEFSSDVQAGTYIRKLISDLGEKIGGAHMIELHRIRAGIFKIKDSFTIQDIEEAYYQYEKGNDKELRKMLIPAEIIKTIIPWTSIKEESLKGLLNGKPLMKMDTTSKIPDSDIFSVFIKERFIGIYKKVDEGDIIARAEFVMN